MKENEIDILLDRVAENLGIKKPAEAARRELEAFSGADARISPSVIRTQADIALSNGKRYLSEYLRIAAEIAAVPDELMSRVASAQTSGDVHKRNELSRILEEEYNAVLLSGILKNG